MAEWQRLGEMLQRHRLASGMSLADAARRAGVSKVWLWELEQGRIVSPGFVPLVAIGLVFGFTPSAVAELAGLHRNWRAA